MEHNTNGSARAPDGTFWMQPHRRFPTDGREPRPIDRLLDLAHRYETLLPYTANPSIEVARKAIREARNYLDEIEYDAVGGHWSWRDIGNALGMSGSGAYRRYAQSKPMREIRPMWKWETGDLEEFF